MPICMAIMVMVSCWHLRYCQLKDPGVRYLSYFSMVLLSTPPCTGKSICVCNLTFARLHAAVAACMEWRLKG